MTFDDYIDFGAFDRSHSSCDSVRDWNKLIGKNRRIEINEGEKGRATEKNEAKMQVHIMAGMRRSH